MNNEMLEKIGERIDRIITLDIRGRGEKCPIMEKLYPAARELYGRPITSFAAETLVKNINKDDTVFIVTGLAAYGMATETDGPVGAVGLGRALQIGLGARPIFMTHHLFKEILAKTAIGGGFLVFSPDNINIAWEKVPSATLVEGFSTDENECRNLSRALIEKYKPKAIIAIEARGPNKEGKYHVVNGTNITEYEAKMHFLFEEAKKNKTLTMSILDGCGIEIGFGTFKEEVIKDYDRYNTCKCGCKSGMKDSTPVDIVLPAAVSNWGAHGIVACISAILNNKNVLHGKQIESRMIQICADEGAMDGTTGRSEIGVDGLSLNIHTSIIQILGEIVDCSLKGYATALKSY